MNKWFGKIRPIEMSPERIFDGGVDETQRSSGSVPIERWGIYAKKVRLLGRPLYDTYEYLPLHIEEVKNTVAFAKENIKNNPDRILVLGSGQNHIEITELHHTFDSPEIIATDIQPVFLETLMMRLSKKNKDAFQNTYPIHMDIGRVWPKEVSDGNGKVIELGSVPMVFCNIVFNWLTEEEQKSVFVNVSERLTKDGDFILATLTNNWNSEEVKKHIPDQLRKNPFWTILGAMGSRKWADKTAAEFGIHRPSNEDISILADKTGLEIKKIDEDRIFWRDKNSNPTAIVYHIKKKQ